MMNASWTNEQIIGLLVNLPLIYGVHPQYLSGHFQFHDGIFYESFPLR